jgi:FkbM family methyltransferase
MSGFAKDSRLIIDLGMNNGDDTAHYLDRGFRVVSLEANPTLCERAQDRFRAAIEAGRLRILNVAISDKAGQAEFYVNLDNDHWSSLDPGWAQRDATHCRRIIVRCVSLSELFDEYGTPYYLKIDVEGIDRSVLEQLVAAGTRPLFVSVEDCRFGFDYLRIMAASGYDRFKLLDQSAVPRMKDVVTGKIFPAGSSGPFGENLPGQWLPYDDMVKYYSATVRDGTGKRHGPRTRWWDIHCTRAAP